MKDGSTKLIHVVVLLMVLCCSAKGALEIYVDQSIGRDDLLCLLGNPSQSIPCANIEYVAIKYGCNSSNITIYVSGQIVVSALVQFNNVSRLSIIGVSEHKPMLLCVLSHNSLHNSYCNSGFKFVDIHSLLISNLEVFGCGIQGEKETVAKTAVAIINCSDVSLVDVDIVSSRGTSLYIENASGEVHLLSLIVKNNNVSPYSFVQPGKSFAGGIQIFLKESSNYTIRNCLFSNISTPRYTELDPSKEPDVDAWLGFGLGGGLFVLFNYSSSHNTVLVDNCTFNRTFAPWGAGLFLKFLKNCSNNSVVVVNSKFLNSLEGLAGGGITIGFVKLTPHAINNTVSVSNSMFKNNRAEYGAGTYIFAYHSIYTVEKGVFVNFNNCSWVENTARYSPAVDISPSRLDFLSTGLLPIPTFQDCTFSRNTIKFAQKRNSTYINSGVFVVSRFTVVFVGTFKFESNAYTALLVNSGQVVFEANTEVEFINNTGFHGGAIALHGFSSLSVSDNCHVLFLNNSATHFGGGIYYYPIEQRELFEGRACFLEYNGPRNSPVSNRNISFVFEGNSAVLGGTSIYSASFFSCYYSYKGKEKDYHVQEFFSFIGNFSFDGNYTIDGMVHALGTTGYRFVTLGGLETFSTLPGKRLFLPLYEMDELDHTLRTEFFITVAATSSTSVFTDSQFTLNRSTILYGAPNETASLVVSTLNAYRNIQHSIEVVFLPCPPGYYYESSTCFCSSSDKHHAYRGISKCNPHNFTAIISSGYWAGYDGDFLSEAEMYTAPCPFQFCMLNTITSVEYSLPNSSEALGSFICGSTRQGILCGQCKQNYSTYYNSKSYKCGKDDKCSYGFLLFAVSELLPVIILFTFIVIFDLSFSSGRVNGFIFFCQIITILPLDYTTFGEALVKLPKEFKYFQNGYYFLYGIFNLEFFSVEQLSFCLFKQATVMDVLAFKYVTTVFAFLLVLLVVACMNHCWCCNKLCRTMKKKVTTKMSVLNGLSACLVICYTKCVQVSFFILEKETLRGAGGTDGPTVAFYGGIRYMENKHLIYAIPAIIALGTIASLPPILLLLYPSGLKLLQLCKVSEHWCVLKALGLAKINALMPMFDVFQGTFKDHFRFFSGLYFLYRVAILSPYLFTESLFGYTVSAQLVLLLMLFIHSAAQPYKLRSHNIIDSLFLSNLAIINGLTISVIKILQDPSSSKILLRTFVFVQTLLVYMPIFALVVLLAVKLCKTARKFVKKSERSDYENLDSYLDEVYIR